MGISELANTCHISFPDIPGKGIASSSLGPGFKPPKDTRTAAEKVMQRPGLGAGCLLDQEEEGPSMLQEWSPGGT